MYKLFSFLIGFSILGVQAQEFRQLPLSEAIVIKKGNGQRQIAIFEDPECPYCYEQENELAKINNVTIYVILYPLLGTASTIKSQSIWCAPDSALAWTQYMRQRVIVPRTCDSPLIKNLQFGKKYSIKGTPTFIFPDNTRVNGFMKAGEIEKQFYIPPTPATSRRAPVTSNDNYFIK